MVLTVWFDSLVAHLCNHTNHTNHTIFTIFCTFCQYCDKLLLLLL